MEAGMAIISFASFVALIPVIKAETTRPNFQEMASVNVYSWLALVKQSGMLTVVCDHRYLIQRITNDT
jgi:hypothetical protein